MKKIEANLENLEKETQRLEDFQITAKKDIDDLIEGSTLLDNNSRIRHMLRRKRIESLKLN